MARILPRASARIGPRGDGRHHGGGQHGQHAEDGQGDEHFDQRESSGALRRADPTVGGWGRYFHEEPYTRPPKVLD
jgi:hypothetical protein